VDKSIGKAKEGRNRCLFEGPFPATVSREREKPYKISVRTAGALSEIQTGHFLNAGQKHYHLGKIPR
jgi:hypothetical protein